MTGPMIFGNLFTLTSGDIVSTTAYTEALFSDFKPLFFIIVGLSLGFAILGTILNVLGIGYKVGPDWKKYRR